MKILILGGTGAMGCPLVEILSNQQHDIYVTSRTIRHSDKSNVHYILGNAQDDIFINSLLDNRYDVLIDFMVYSTEQFAMRCEHILESVGQYIFLSSARIYASGEALTENSPRLLDTLNDEAYLKTDEYALAKARQEDLLHRAKKRNYTIVRPYMTYNTTRLQLGALEKEYWLHRILQRRSFVFQRDIAAHTTTMTYGDDVAKGISLLVGREEAFGEDYNITSNESMSWGEILAIYKRILQNVFEYDVEVIEEENSEKLIKCFNNSYQVCHDRLYQRAFDNSKIMNFCGNQLDFVRLEDGLEMCIARCIENNIFLTHNIRWESYCDSKAGYHRDKSVIVGKDALKYFIFRYVPGVRFFR